MKLRIGKKTIGEDSPTFVIAEAGVNHNGDIGLAKKLVDETVKAGADAVKFQIFDTRALIRLDAPKAPYQSRNIGEKKSQLDMLEELELGRDEVVELKKYCDEQDILFLITLYDIEALKSMESLGCLFYKLASIDIVNHTWIRQIARTGKPLIVSCGLATEAEIQAAVAAFTDAAGGPDNLVLLQCNTNYPAKTEEQNLRVMDLLKKYVPIVGFSDHTVGNVASIAAVALGASVIERHFTLDKNMAGPDHKASYDPAEMTQFIKDVRMAEAALGQAVKNGPTPGELENIIGVRRSICARRDIAKETVITAEHLAFKRPGDGLAPADQKLALLLGKKAGRNIQADENILLEDVN